MKGSLIDIAVKQALLVMFIGNVLFSSAQNVHTETFSLDKHPEIKKRFNRREKNESFLETTLNYSALSYVAGPHTDVGSPKGWYILSSDIIPEFVIGGRWMPVPVHLTPRYKVRMFHFKQGVDSSFAVRTPSFMPGATIHFPIRFHKEDHNITYASLSVFHHSNGQDEPEFNPDGTVNTATGNFSTNYIEPAFHFRNRKTFFDKKPAFTCDGSPKGYTDFYGRIGTEFHFATAAKLRDSYGKTRINAELGWISVKNYPETIKKVKVSECYDKEVHRIVVKGTFITGSRKRGLNEFDKRINLEVNYFQRIPSSTNAAGFASIGYYGSDPYNIYYENSYFYLRVGVALGFFVYPGLKKIQDR